MEHDRFNQLLRECEIELSNAEYELSALIDSDEDIDEVEFAAKTDELMGRIDILTKQYESLLQIL